LAEILAAVRGVILRCVVHKVRQAVRHASLTNIRENALYSGSLSRDFFFCTPNSTIAARACFEGNGFVMQYGRIITQGTINEPKGNPNPQFALQSTVSWMLALRLLIEAEGVNFESAAPFYAASSKRKMGVHEENTVLEQLFLGLHHFSILEQFRSGTRASDYARVGLLAWYYGVANAASAMRPPSPGPSRRIAQGRRGYGMSRSLVAGWPWRPSAGE
jgi:hypothetical protein